MVTEAIWNPCRRYSCARIRSQLPTLFQPVGVDVLLTDLNFPGISRLGRHLRTAGASRVIVRPLRLTGLTYGFLVALVRVAFFEAAKRLRSQKRAQLRKVEKGRNGLTRRFNPEYALRA